MTNLQKIKLASILSSCQFWYPTFILYFQYRGLTISQALFLMTLYSVFALVMEYPTGVVADYLSPKISLTAGYILMALCFFAQTFPANFWFYAVTMFVTAIGFTLTSGSNTALLHSASQNFKHDYAQVKMWSLVMTVFSSVVGGLTIAFDLRYAHYLTSFFFLISAGLLLLSKNYPYTKITGNIFEGSMIGIKYVKTNKHLQLLLILSGVIGGFFMSFKFFYAPLLSEMNLPETSWGVYIGIATLLSAAGVHLFKKHSNANLLTLLFGLISAFLLMSVLIYPVIGITGLFLCYFLRGYLETKVDTLINESITSHARASILSLESFITRISSTTMTFVLGIYVVTTSFSLLIAITAGVILALTLWPVLKLQKAN